jgi:hypothetical protein
MQLPGGSKEGCGRPFPGLGELPAGPGEGVSRSQLAGRRLVQAGVAEGGDQVGVLDRDAGATPGFPGVRCATPGSCAPPKREAFWSASRSPCARSQVWARSPSPNEAWWGAAASPFTIRTIARFHDCTIRASPFSPLLFPSLFSLLFPFRLPSSRKAGISPRAATVPPQSLRYESPDADPCASPSLPALKVSSPA